MFQFFKRFQSLLLVLRHVPDQILFHSGTADEEQCFIGKTRVKIVFDDGLIVGKGAYPVPYSKMNEQAGKEISHWCKICHGIGTFFESLYGFPLLSRDLKPEYGIA